MVGGSGFRGWGYGLDDGRSGSVLPVGYVVSARRIADRRMILAGYRLADLLTRLLETMLEQFLILNWAANLA
jgi:hypothetical protein